MRAGEGPERTYEVHSSLAAWWDSDYVSVKFASVERGPVLGPGGGSGFESDTAVVEEFGGSPQPLRIGLPTIYGMEDRKAGAAVSGSEGAIKSQTAEIASLVKSHTESRFPWDGQGPDSVFGGAGLFAACLQPVPGRGGRGRTRPGTCQRADLSSSRGVHKVAEGGL